MAILQAKMTVLFKVNRISFGLGLLACKFLAIQRLTFTLA